MNWQHFQTYNEASTRAFEAMCNQLFELWIDREYKEDKKSFTVVNGAGGDGGVESYATLVNGKKIGVQAKWFPDNITLKQFKQIKESILTALDVHNELIKYIVCIPRDLSNSKKGKDGKIVRETEYSKWNKMVTDIKNEFQDIEIILWGDYCLERQLQYVEAAGVRRYWFEKTEITRAAIQYSFEKQKSGWLSQRYIPVLHNQGIIHKKTNSFLGDLSECIYLLEKLKYIEKNYEVFGNEIKVLAEFLNEKKLYNDDITQIEISELSNRVKKQLIEVSKYKDAFINENKITNWYEHILSYEKIEMIVEWLEEQSCGENFLHFSDAKKALVKIRNVNMSELCESLKSRCNFEKIIIVGGPGTGKTHGIANMVDVLLERNYHIPILIQARSIPPQDEWKDILIRVLGLSQVWSEDELWTALEALSYRNEINCPPIGLNKKSIRIIPKILICIDGIDEVKPYTRWNERMNQVNIISSRHPRIKFCFTGRSYAFEQKAGGVEKQKLNRVNLSDDGDVPVKTIYRNYIDYFHVDDEGAKWLCHILSTPYTLKLLCEVYEGKSIGQIDKSDVIITRLLFKYFEKLNQEFKLLAGFEENEKDQIVKSVLIKINTIFEEQSEATGNEIKDVLRKLEVYHYLGEPGLEKILDFLEKRSFLQSYQKYTKSIFDEDETIYMIGVQPVYDYLKALRLFEKDEYSDELRLDDHVLNNMGALQMYSVMVMDHYEKILWFNKFCRENLNEEVLFESVAFALVNVDVEISQKYKEWIIELMGCNAYVLSLTVNKIILPLAREERHPLGSQLLDKYLRGFDKPADRDIVWSVPSGLRGNNAAIWFRYENIDYFNAAYTLEDTDVFDGMPLVWAWGLTSVDNRQRTRIRKEITKWGVAQPEEFYKLFQCFADVNDTQAQVDIFAIAMAVTHVCRKNCTYLKLISKWIYHNIFAVKKIKSMHNAAIRYYSRAIIECAFSDKIINNSQIDKCRPPYRIDTLLLPFAPEATKGTRTGGYKTIDYDLSRYVLCDPLDRMFLANKYCNVEIDKIVKKYGRKYHLPNLTSEKFVLGCGFGYIKSAGWNEDIFYGLPNGGKTGEKLGLDIAISRQFRPATHGIMSQTMTFTEKYTWCAKMELLGYLADRLPYNNRYKDGVRYVEDYGNLEDYVNPYQELCQIDIDKKMEETEWILPEELTPSIKECNYDQDGIQKWLRESPVPDFRKWVNIKSGEITLYALHDISNEEQGVTTMMWIYSGLISKGTMPSFTKALKNNDLVEKLIDSSGIFAYPDADCYISPLEVCWYDWKSEYDSEIIYGNHTLYKNLTKCTCKLQEMEETEYEIPSKKLRNILGIISGDGYHYYNDNGFETAHYMDAGERYGNNQHMLLANSEIFFSKISELGLQPIWVIRVLKEVSFKAREKYNFFEDRDETYLVWENSQRWQTRKIEWENEES